MRASVLLDEGSVAAGNGGLSAERGCPGDSGVCVGHCGRRGGGEGLQLEQER